MRLHQPIEFEIPVFRCKKWKLKKGVRLFLSIHPPKSSEDFNYWEQEAEIDVEIIRYRVGHSERRKTIRLPQRISHHSVPRTVFDSSLFIDELNCDVGLLFAHLCAPRAQLEAKIDRKKRQARLRLLIADSYSSETTLPLDEVMPFLAKR